MRPYVFVETIWSDDTKTKSEPVEEWWGQWILITYGDAEFWKDQIRPIRAILKDKHYFIQEELIEQ